MSDSGHVMVIRGALCATLSLSSIHHTWVPTYVYCLCAYMFVPAGTDRTLGCHAGNINPTRVYELCLCLMTVMGAGSAGISQTSTLEEQWVAALMPKKVADKAAEALCRRRHDGSARWVAVQRCTCRAAQRSTLARGLSWLHLIKARKALGTFTLFKQIAQISQY